MTTSKVTVVLAYLRRSCDGGQLEQILVGAVLDAQATQKDHNITHCLFSILLWLLDNHNSKKKILPTVVPWNASDPAVSVTVSVMQWK